VADSRWEEELQESRDKIDALLRTLGEPVPVEVEAALPG
jgi:anthranilate/para-aminobenzoate synthase component I